MTDLSVAPAKSSGPLVLRTSIGKKYAMAISGVVLVGFVIAHMVGNLKFFYGETHFDEYAHFLRTVGEPVIPYHYLLWALRGVLLAAVGVHIWAAYSTTMQSRRARPIPYAHADTIQADYASRTMRWGGVILLLFIIFHILDMTVGTAHVGDFEEGKVYDNAISGFQNPAVTISYTLAMGALCLHLYHGIWSMFQTVGRNNHRVTGRLHGIALVIAVVVTIGFLAMPWAILFGMRP